MAQAVSVGRADRDGSDSHERVWPGERRVRAVLEALGQVDGDEGRRKSPESDRSKHSVDSAGKSPWDSGHCRIRAEARVRFESSGVCESNGTSDLN